jgi:hypothetical protein
MVQATIPEFLDPNLLKPKIMLQKRAHPRKAAIALLLIAAASFNAQSQDWKTEKKINVVFGGSQLLVHGFNYEFNYIHKRMIFDFSHGVSLLFKDGTVPAELRTQGVAVHMPWTIGVGAGYRLTEWLNIRVEPKWHRFEFYYENAELPKNQIISYNTFTLGLGLYGSYQPFKKKNNFLKGILIAPSIRYWPTVASTLKDNQFTYANQHTGTTEVIKNYGPGVGLTPLILNISFGYTFQIKKKA